jgi:hypothetical protein
LKTQVATLCQSYWQISDAPARRGKNGVANSGRHRYQRRLTQTTWESSAIDKLDIKVGHITHTQGRVSVKILLRYLSRRKSCAFV